MAITDAMHTGFQVSDMDASIHFFCDLLGLEVVSDEVRGGWLADIRREPGAVARIVMIKGYGIDVELLGFDPPPPDPISHSRGAGVADLAFHLTDLQGFYEQLVAEGVDFLFEPRTGARGQPMTFAIGPDGILVELIQVAPTA